MQTVLHKVGTTFVAAVSIDTDITGWTVKSQVRKLDGNLVADLTFALVEAGELASTYTLTKLDTSTWVEGKYHWDIRYTEPDGKITTTETVEVNVVRSITR